MDPLLIAMIAAICVVCAAALIVGYALHRLREENPHGAVERKGERG